MQRLAEVLSDQMWRLRNLYAIKPKTGPVGHYPLNVSQEWLLKRFWFRNFILKARKMGFSTLIDLLGVDRCIFNGRQEMVIIDKTLDDAKDKLQMCRLAWETMGLHTPGLTPDQRLELNSLLRNSYPLVGDSRTELAWGNGSIIKARASHRGGNPDFLHVSELGHIALERPKIAEEILTGSLESVARGNFVTFESTHKGGKFGANYRMLRLAQDNEGLDELDTTDFRFHFFPWFWDAANVVSGTYKPRLHPDEEKYFAQLAENPTFRALNKNRPLSDDQIRWWCRKKRTLGHEMGREHPSVPSEAIEAPMEGSIWGSQLADIRAQGRIGQDFGCDPLYPVWCAWDIGSSDYTAIWAVQVAGQEILWHDWHEARREEPGHYAGIIREWQQRYPIAGHFLPHDAENDTFTGSAKAALTQAGLENIVVLPRCRTVWDGIRTMRRLIPRSRFHARVCRDRIENGEELPSGLAHLEAYRTHIAESGSVIREEPVHDEHSHTSDAARYFAEAWEQGKVLDHFPRAKGSRRQVPERAILG